MTGLGRILQGVGLATLPVAIWVGELERSERGMITIFVASVLIFGLGTFLTRLKQ